MMIRSPGSVRLISVGSSFIRAGMSPTADTKTRHFADIAGMKKDLAEGGGDSAFIPPVLDPFDDPVQKPAGMEFGLKGTGIIPGAYAEAVTSQAEPGAFTRTHGVPVDPDDPGQGPAVRFHVGRAIVGLGGDAIIVVFIKPGHAGIIPKDRDHPILLPLYL